jgi:integrase
MRTVTNQIKAEIGHLRPSQLTPLITGALVSRWRTKHRQSTAANYTHQLKRLLRVLETFGAPRIELPRVPRPKQRAVTASLEEMARILKEPPAFLRLFILLYFQCGLRFSETLRVTPQTWDRTTHTVTVQVKGKHDRITPVTADVEALFISAGDPDPSMPYIWALRGKTLSHGELHRVWRAHKAKSGVNPAVTAHDLRRTAASIIYASTHDLRAAQALLGHHHLTSTLSYLAPLAPEEARKYQELLRFEHFKSEVKQ